MGLQSSPVLLLRLRQLNRFLKRQGLHSAARTFVRLPPLAGEGVSSVLRRRASAEAGEERALGSRRDLPAPLLAAYRSMASKQARASVDWEAIKLATLEKLQELLRLSPDLERSLRMREPQCTSTPSEIIPLELRSSQRHQRKRVGSKPARELALSFQQKRLSTSQETGHSDDSGRKRLRSQDDYCNGFSQKPFDPTKCFKRPRMAGDIGECKSSS
ncbi:unnamed protein product [Urochloa decumbens]|uniref:Uncharacterized protein n=1 Tax=Urochloa decumbens TaxID=240449 RepID=A0ABC8Z1L5_9POAL